MCCLFYFSSNHACLVFNHGLQLGLGEGFSHRLYKENKRERERGDNKTRRKRRKQDKQEVQVLIKMILYIVSCRLFKPALQ